MSKLEIEVQEMNSSITAISRIIEAIENRDFVCGVETIEDEKGVGYRIAFNKAGTITVYNGKSAPELGIIRLDDGRYYWTIGGNLLKDMEGQPLSVNGEDGLTPRLKVEDGYWWISYDGLNYEKIARYYEENVNSVFFLSETETEVFFSLWDGTVISLPKEAPLFIELEEDHVSLKWNTTKRVAFKIHSSLTPVSIEAVSSGKINSRVILDEDNPITGYVEVYLSGDTNEYSKVVLIATNGRETTMSTLTVEREWEQDELQVVKMVGDKLYIGYPFSDTEDLLIVFSKCMYNKLMSFSQVGFAPNNGQLHQNPARTIQQIVNYTSSDNIGPVCVDKIWAGGNHSVTLDGIQVATAECESFSFFADGRKLSDGDCLNAKRIEVQVVNRLYNPSQFNAAENTFGLLCMEDVTYTVEKGNIMVFLQHTYPPSSSTITTYYGMQSSFRSENYIFTPNGPYSSFSNSSDVRPFNKNRYPDFCTYIEKNGERYQSSFLFPEGVGNHSQIASDGKIFTRASGKSYHWLIQDKTIDSGLQYYWKGLYTWFSPFYEDEDMFVYEAFAEGSPVLFINLKSAYDGHVPIPQSMSGKDFQIISKPVSVFMGSQTSDSGIWAKSSGPAGVVIKML